ncbi:MAG: serine--tRNA ligase, partial [Vulcanimicrobiaceae bacterium]
MLDIGLIRRDPEGVRRAAARKGDASWVDPVLELDAQRREAQTRLDMARAAKNNVTKEIARSSDHTAAALQHADSLRSMDNEIKLYEVLLGRLPQRISELLGDVPNLPDPSVPDGEGPDDNIEVRRWGARPAFDFAPKPHWEIGEALGVLDFERAAKLSGSRFTLLSG